jgi:hypothetical protein
MFISGVKKLRRRVLNGDGDGDGDELLRNFNFNLDDRAFFRGA